MEINGKTKLMGLIGNPVEHTLSPVIHNTIASCMNENMAYLPFPVKEDLEMAVKGAYALGVQGMNVTVPYKSAVMPSLVNVDEQAAIIGAVNTLVRVDGGYKGYNTDLPGLYRAMRSDGIELADAKVVILGAGGAARSAAFLCAFHKAKEVYILNRTVQKAALVAEEVKEKTGFIRGMWCEGLDCELKIKEDTGVTSRCMPFNDQEQISENCVCCGKPAHKLVYWGKAY